jgi:hypothetical protein
MKTALFGPRIGANVLMALGEKAYDHFVVPSSLIA